MAKPLLTRIKEVFFPPVFESGHYSDRLPALARWEGTPDAFFDQMNRMYSDNWVARWTTELVGEVNPRAIFYYDVRDKSVIGMCVRWPNRYYYYTAV